MIKKEPKLKIFMVDDDAVYLKALEIELNNLQMYDIVTFGTGEDCLNSNEIAPDLVILDYQLDGMVKGAMNGIQTLDKLQEKYKNVRVIMLSGQDKISVAVECMLHNALDYVVKSETAIIHIQKIITNLVKYIKIEKELKWYMERL